LPATGQSRKILRDEQTTQRDVILEVAPLHVKAGQGAAFEAAFRQAQRIIAAMPGYVAHALQHCIERPGEYILLVTWRSLEDHEAGFRSSPEYQAWKQLLHHFYEPFPVVSHYVAVAGTGSAATIVRE
jgi:heme-degrading monooxygenase HmoA